MEALISLKAILPNPPTFWKLRASKGREKGGKLFSLSFIMKHAVYAVVKSTLFILC